jgi:hypothetical protein
MSGLSVMIPCSGRASEGGVVNISETVHRQIFSGKFSGEDFPVLAKLSEIGREGCIPVFFLKDFSEELKRLYEANKEDSLALGAINSLLGLTQEAIAAGQQLLIVPQVSPSSKSRILEN